MPKRASTVVVMQEYAALSSRRWYGVVVKKIGRAGRGTIRIEMTLVDDPSQTGRVVEHDVPAIVAPGSPLATFLVDGFGIELKENQPFDLTQLVGRRLDARFTKSTAGQVQSIAAVRCCVVNGAS